MTTAAPVETARTALWFHALSDETRLEIIQLLSGGERCVCDLTDALEAAQSRLSFHLKTLRDAEIVNDRRVGRWIYYSLNRDTMIQIEETVRALRPSARVARLDACCG